MNQDNWARRISRAMEARLAGEELRRDHPPRLTMEHPLGIPGAGTPAWPRAKDPASGHRRTKERIP